MQTIIVPQEVKELAQAVASEGFRLYIVGGYIRDQLLGYESTDIDICGNIPLENMINMATSRGFSTHIIQKELGTLLIKKGDIEMEYTRWRKELYDKGNHRPTEVEWVDNLEDDAMRRDFTINCIYYDINTEEIVDIYNGRSDLKEKVVKTIRTPKEVLCRDGLRILRAMRFAQELGFGIDMKTTQACREYVYLLRDISKERILVELKKIFFAYQRHNLEGNHLVALRILNEWKIWKQIIPTIAFEKISLNYHQVFFWMKDQNILAYRFYRNVYMQCPDELAYLGMLMLLVLSDIGETLSSAAIKYSVMKILGNDGLKESKYYQKSVEKMLFCMLRRQQFETTLSYRQFAIAFHDYHEREKKLLYIMDEAYYKKVDATYYDLQLKNIPLKMTDMDCKAEDLAQLGYPEKMFGKILNDLWGTVLLETVPNKKEYILKYLKNKS